MNRNKENLVLIGLPTSGKSTVGVIAAKALGYDFIDGDILIQKQTGKRLCEIMEESGTEAFLRLEEEIHSRLDCRRCVIAPGGSIIYGGRAMEHLKEIGTVIYLQMDYEALKERLHNARERGVSLREGQTIRDLYDERIPLYEKYADITIPESHRSIESVVIDVMTRYNSLKKAVPGDM